VRHHIVVAASQPGELSSSCQSRSCRRSGWSRGARSDDCMPRSPSWRPTPAHTVRAILFANATPLCWLPVVFSSCSAQVRILSARSGLDLAVRQDRAPPRESTACAGTVPRLLMAPSAVVERSSLSRGVIPDSSRSGRPDGNRPHRDGGGHGGGRHQPPMPGDGGSCVTRGLSPARCSSCRSTASPGLDVPISAAAWLSVRAQQPRYGASRRPPEVSAGAWYQR